MAAGNQRLVNLIVTVRASSDQRGKVCDRDPLVQAAGFPVMQPPVAEKHLLHGTQAPGWNTTWLRPNSVNSTPSLPPLRAKTSAISELKQNWCRSIANEWGRHEAAPPRRPGTPAAHIP